PGSGDLRNISGLFALPLFPALMFGRILVFEIVLARRDVVVLADYRFDISAAAVALQDLMHRQPGLYIFLWLMLEDVATSIRAEVKAFAFMYHATMAQSGVVVRFGERQRNLTDLAQHRQCVVIEPLA